MRASVFVGPSLAPEEAADILPVEMLPPIQRGDIDALLDRPEPPQYIGIIDGKFLQSFSISPKEILKAVDKGIHVFGASSMGALRAAELAPFGMTGVGTVYEMYQSGQVEDDDEVAITFDTETLRAICDPMVNIRVAVAEALRRGHVSAEHADLFLATAKETYFPQRTTAATLHQIKGRLPQEDHRRLAEFLRSPQAPDAKREDAVAMLTAMCQAMDAGRGGAAADGEAA